MSAELDVVIPVRDVDAYLEEAIDSALAQDVEVAVVVVDAGSVTPIRLPDRLAGDPRIRLVRSEEPLYVGAARNLGAAHGSAPWLGFLDGDDLWPADTRRALLDAAAEDGHGAVGLVEHFGQPGASEGLVVPPELRPSHLAGGVIVSRARWLAIGEFDPALRTGEFVDWFARARAAGTVFAATDEVVLRRRVHRASTTATQRADRSEYLEVVRRWMNRTES